MLQAGDRCRDDLDGILAKLSCDAERILLAHPIEIRPNEPQPTGATRRVLDAVARLLNERDDILFVRIEAYSSERAEADRTVLREQVLESQRRADAVLRYLWKKRGISAERMEAVGYGPDLRFRGVRTRWPIVIRVVQWARR